LNKIKRNTLKAAKSCSLDHIFSLISKMANIIFGFVTFLSLVLISFGGKIVEIQTLTKEEPGLGNDMFRPDGKISLDICGNRFWLHIT